MPLDPRIPLTITAQHKSAGPLVLVYSPRDRVRDILAVGLAQSDYRVIKADSAHLATIKAYQFLPDLVIADITADHTKDILLVPRLRKSVRTAATAVLLIMPPKIRDTLQKALADANETAALAPREGLDLIEYPFNFSDLQKRVLRMVTQKPQESPATDDEEEARRNRIARELFDLEVPAERKLRDLEQTISKQWAFPFTVIRALDIIESSASCCAELGSCIATDPGAASAILRVANTIPYAKRAKTVSDITEAVVRLGFRETRNLLACLALIDLSPDLSKRYGFSRKDFWLHSLTVAVIAERLSGVAGHRRPELAFIAGLVHDLGKIPLDNNFNRVFSTLLEETANQVTCFSDTEERLMGMTHADLGHFLATKWNFPSSIAQGILNHHRAERVLSVPTPIDRLVQEAVFAGNILAKAMNSGHSCDEFIDEIPVPMLRELKIPHGPDERFLIDIQRGLRVLCSNLNVAVRAPGAVKAPPADEASDITVVLGKNTSFHPIVLALRSNGYHARVVNQYNPAEQGKTRVVISISEKGCPIDVMLYEDDTENPPPVPQLRIFLVDTLPDQELTRGFEEGSMMFLNRRHLDMRYIMHTLDHFLEKVVVPPPENPSPEQAGQT